MNSNNKHPSYPSGHWSNQYPPQSYSSAQYSQHQPYESGGYSQQPAYVDDYHTSSGMYSGAAGRQDPYNNGLSYGQGGPHLSSSSSHRNTGQPQQTAYSYSHSHSPSYGQPRSTRPHSHAPASYQSTHSAHPGPVLSPINSYPSQIPLSTAQEPVSSQYDYPNSNRPFSCDICTLSFSRQHDLRRHKETHKGDKPFLCNGGCGKTFTRKDALKRHQIVKTCGKVDSDE